MHEITQEDIREYFQPHLTAKNLLNIAPQRIFNTDETNMQLCPRFDKVVAKKGSATVYKVVDAN